MKKYIVCKCYEDEIEYLPDITDTPIWQDYDSYAQAPSKDTRLAAVLYKAVADRENYFQFNTPTAFGNPDYSRLCGIVSGIIIGAELEEEEKNDQLIFKKNGKTILIVDKIRRSRYYYEAVKDNAETMRALGF